MHQKKKTKEKKAWENQSVQDNGVQFPEGTMEPP